jgi:hypothetical protein
MQCIQEPWTPVLEHDSPEIELTAPIMHAVQPSTPQPPIRHYPWCIDIGAQHLQ